MSLNILICTPICAEMCTIGRVPNEQKGWDGKIRLRVAIKVLKLHRKEIVTHTQVVEFPNKITAPISKDLTIIANKQKRQQKVSISPDLQATKAKLLPPSKGHKMHNVIALITSLVFAILSAACEPPQALVRCLGRRQSALVEGASSIPQSSNCNVYLCLLLSVTCTSD